MTDSNIAAADVQRGAPAHRNLLRRIFGLFRGGPSELARASGHSRVPFLDGLRAFAVLLVVNSHSANDFANLFGTNAYARFPLTSDGWMGVDLFFVLSGYFIGSQLWKELEKSGTVSIKLFMIRRGLRIWPLYFFMFAVVFTFMSRADLIVKQYGWSDIVFLTNYLGHGIVGGSWSLASEEQFYLLAPLALLLIGRRSMAGYRWGLALLLMLEVVVRIATYVHLTGHFFAKDIDGFRALYYPFHTHSDGLIAGMIVANFDVATKGYKGLLARPGLLVLIGAVVLLVCNRVQGATLDFFGFAVFFSALVWWGVQSGTKLFSQHIFYLLSRLSFGMYLIHEHIMHGVTLTVGNLLHGVNPNVASIATSLALVVCSMALSAVTFCLIEHPFLNLRTAILRRQAIPRLVAH